MPAHLYAQLSSRFPAGAKLAFETPAGALHSYADVAAGAARMAGALVALGVKPGDRVAVQIEKSLAAVLLYLGCARAGAVFLPLNTAYTASEVEYFLTDAEPTVFVCDPKRKDSLAGARSAAKVAHVETLDGNGKGTLSERAASMPGEFADVERGPDDLAGILYTSGTTGRSKGAMISQENLASNARALVDYWRFTSDDTLIHALPIYHTPGLFVAIHVLLMAGG